MALFFRRYILLRLFTGASASFDPQLFHSLEDDDVLATVRARFTGLGDTEQPLPAGPPILSYFQWRSATLVRMSLDQILSEIDAEIARLENVRDLLAEATTASKSKRTTAKPGRKRRKLSTEARARIAAAQRKRWAKQKRGAK